MSVSQTVATCYGEARQPVPDGTERAFLSPDVLRIKVESDSGGQLIRMAGRLAYEFLGEAEQVCRPAEAPLRIDASELQSADADGVAFLATILDRGGRMEGLSEYLAMCVSSVREGRRG